MNRIWSLTLDEYFEIVEKAKKGGCQPGESMEKYVKEYMEEKNRKSIGFTELTKEEMITEQLSHGKNVLNMNVDKSGNTKFEFTKGDQK